MANRAMLVDQLTALQSDLKAPTALADETKKEAATKTLEDAKKELAFQGDQWFYRIVVLALSIALLGVIVAITILNIKGRTGYEALTAIGSAAIGALAGLLAPSPVSK